MGKQDFGPGAYLKMPVAPGKSINLGLCISGVLFIVVSKYSEESPFMNLLPHLIVGKTGLPWVGGASQIHRECVWCKNLKTKWCIYVHCSYVSINSFLRLWGVSCDHPTSQDSFWGRWSALTPRQCSCFSGPSLLTSTSLGIYVEKINLPDTLKTAQNHPENLCSRAWFLEAAREEESLFFLISPPIKSEVGVYILYHGCCEK